MSAGTARGSVVRKGLHDFISVNAGDGLMLHSELSFQMQTSGVAPFRAAKKYGAHRWESEGSFDAARPLLGSVRALAQEQVLPHVGVMPVAAGLDSWLPIRRYAPLLQRFRLAARRVTARRSAKYCEVAPLHVMAVMS